MSTPTDRRRPREDDTISTMTPMAALATVRRMAAARVRVDVNLLNAATAALTDDEIDGILTRLPDSCPDRGVLALALIARTAIPNSVTDSALGPLAAAFVVVANAALHAPRARALLAPLLAIMAKLSLRDSPYPNPLDISPFNPETSQALHSAWEDAAALVPYEAIQFLSKGAPPPTCQLRVASLRFLLADLLAGVAASQFDVAKPALSSLSGRGLQRTTLAVARQALLLGWSPKLDDYQ